jgi:hypothetical protein
MKYLGGKQRLGKHLSPVLKELWNYVLEITGKQLDGYLEPFCGSLGVFRNMTDLNTNKLIANDYHPDLIQMWNEVKYGTFIYPDAVSEEEYIAAKKLESPNALKAFIGFGMSFGGRFFGAFAHKYTNDKKEDFCKEMTHSLKRAAPLIKNSEFIRANKQQSAGRAAADLARERRRAGAVERLNKMRGLGPKEKIPASQDPLKQPKPISEASKKAPAKKAPAKKAPAKKASAKKAASKKNNNRQPTALANLLGGRRF